MAPESILRKGTGLPSDCWAFGVTLYEMSTMNLLLCDPADPGNLTKIFGITLRSRKHGLPIDAAFAQQRPALASIIRRLMVYDCTKRLDMHACLQDAFFSGVDMARMRRKQAGVPDDPLVVHIVRY